MKGGLNMKYNYVFFNSTDNTRKIDFDGYYTICICDLFKLPNVQVITYPVDYANKFIRCLYSAHHTPKTNMFFELPLKKCWYPFYFKNKFKNNENICFVLSGSYITPDYVKYLKEKYPKAKFVKIYRDLLKVWLRDNPEWDNGKTEELIDLQMSFDQNEAHFNGWEYFCEFESKIQVPKDVNYPIADVFFAGKAKDRLPKLMQIYSMLTEAGLKCEYFLTGVPKDERVVLPGITYSDKFMSYREMLYKTVNSRVVLEINQRDAIGYTSRFLEAVMFNKKLITNNPSIKNSKFFSKNNILCIDNIDNKIVDFVKNSDIETVNYHYNNEFSPIRLIEQIDKILIKKFGDI